MIRPEQLRRDAQVRVLQRNAGCAEVVALLELCDTMVQETALKLVHAAPVDVPRLQGQAQAYEALARLIRRPDIGQEQA